MAGGIVVVVTGSIVAFRFFAPPQDDAVELVPRAATIYVSAFLEPSRSQRLALRGLVERLELPSSPQGPQGAIARAVDAVLDEGDLTFGEIEPWAGDEVAFFGLPARSRTIGAAVVAVDDHDAARRTLARVVAGDTEPHVYRGVRYSIDRRADARGIVGDFVVAGDVGALKASVDALNGDSLADSESFREATSELPDDRLGLAYTERVPLPPALGPLERAHGGVAFALSAQEDGLVLEASFARTAPEAALAERLLGSRSGLGGAGGERVARRALDDGYSPKALFGARDAAAIARVAGPRLPTFVGSLLQELDHVAVGSRAEGDRVLHQLVFGVR